MKKYDEGYVLAYVTVVLLIFCLVATVILTGAMRNLEHQQNVNQKMKDQYVVAGMIEQIISHPQNYSFVKDTAVTANVICTEVQGNVITVVATYNTVAITCSFDKTSGVYILYEVSVIEPVTDGNGGGN